MSGHHVSVAFGGEAPLPGLDQILLVLNTAEGPVRYLNCTEVKYDGGFLRLKPVLPESWGPMVLHVHPHHVVWMLEGDFPPQKPGFV